MEAAHPKKEVPWQGTTESVESVTLALAKLTCSNHWNVTKKHKQQEEQQEDLLRAQKKKSQRE
jgi:hypothetical protein